MNVKTKEFINNIRLVAFEELRQEVKLANWPIGSLLIVEKAIENLKKKVLSKKYQQLD
jgi:hypothetical protein